MAERRISIGTIGFENQLTENDTLLDIFNRPHLDHFEYFIIRLGVLPSLLHKSFGVVGSSNPQVSVDRIAYEECMRPLLETLARIKMLVAHGARLVVILDRLLPVLYFNQEEGVHPWCWIDEGLTFEPLTGSEVSYVGPDLGEENGVLLQGANFRYVQAVRSVEPVSPLFVTPSRVGSARNVGISKQIGSGQLIFLPNSWLLPLSGKFEQFRGDICLKLIQIINSAAQSTRPEQARPQWTNEYLLDEQRKIRNSLKQATIQIEHLQAQLTVHRAAAEEKAWQQDLLFTSGVSLEASVIMAFANLKLPVVAGPHSRADALVLIGSTLLVCEIKGFDGGAKEAGIAQCVRWIKDIEVLRHPGGLELDTQLAAYIECLKQIGALTKDDALPTDLHLKGCVICNTFHNEPLSNRPSLSDRPTEHFPQPLQTRANAESIVLMTSYQLLGLLSGNAGTSSQDLDLLISTRGVFNSYRDWKDYLS